MMLALCARFLNARGSDLVGDVHIEVKSQGKRELQPGAHTGRVGLYGLVKGLSQFGELFDTRDAFRQFILEAVDAADEFGVLAAGELSFQAAGGPVPRTTARTPGSRPRR